MLLVRCANYATLAAFRGYGASKKAAMEKQMQLTERQKHHLERMQAHAEAQATLVQILECLLSEQNRRKNVAQRKPFYQTVGISSIVPYKVDYRDRKHVWLYSANTLTLSLEDLGQITVPQNTWTNISFQPGMFIYAVGQSTTAYIYIKNTDETIP